MKYIIKFARLLAVDSVFVFFFVKYSYLGHFAYKSFLKLKMET